jgi:pyruvate-formate lyase
MVSERIKRMRETILTLERINEVIPKEHIAYDPETNRDKSPIVRHAGAVKELFHRVSINHIPGEKIAGNNTLKYSPRPNHLTKAELEEIKRYPEGVSKEAIAAMDEQIFYLWSFIQGHIVPDKELVLKKGIHGIMRDIETRLEDRDLNREQKDFLEASLVECRSFLDYVKRHVEFFESRASEAASAEEKTYFMDLADLCRKVPAEPAGSFREALQSVWFAQIATQFDDCANHSLGRMDQYLYPYYKKDVERGVLTKEEARELFYEFWLKFNLGYKLQELSGTKMGLRADDPDSKEVVDKREYDLFNTMDGTTWLALKCISQVNHSDDGQTMDIAGLDGDGNDATNELSWLILDAEDELRAFEPKSVIKHTEKTDRNFMRRAYEILASGFGLPAITFHEAGAKGMRSYNLFAEEDILNHSHIGCIELGIPGKSFTDPMNAFMNLPKIMLITMNNGHYNGRRIGLELNGPKSWDQFVDNFFRQLDHFVRLYTETMNEAGAFYARYFARPLVSALVEGCIDKAVPVDRGGAKYWSRSVNSTGFATAVDSLFSVRKVVYTDRRMSLEDFARILERNYEGEEDFRLMVKNRIPKFGNGVEEVDELAGEVGSMFSEIVRKYRNAQGNAYRPGLYSFYEPIKTMGRVTGATPDGRKSGEVLSLNSAPYHGAVKNGLSDVLRSVTAIEHSKFDNASVIDVKLSGRTTPEVIGYIVEYLAKRDVLYAQFTVVDKEKLVEAQKTPERYQDLTVRVTGFSARFVVLPKDTQEEIIQRSCWN